MSGTRSRLESLDVIRGMAVAAMILVNNPGNWVNVYPPLVHSAWDGCTFADLIFPAFIVIMGMALPWTLDRHRARGTDPRAVASRVAVRVLTLIAIGLALNVVVAWPDWQALRIPGVLQRIAFTYALTTPIVWRLRVRGQLAAAAVLLLAHWGLVARVPGYLSIDRTIFGLHSLTPMGDPEGLLGLLPSVATALLGSIAGWWIASARTVTSRAAGLAAGGGLAAMTGLAWSLVLPLNKFVWSGSFALFSAGVTVLAFTLCFVTVDGWRLRAWARPFAWLGLNPLAIYALSELVAHLIERPWLRPTGAMVVTKDVIFWRGFVPLVGDFGGARSSLLYAAVYAMLWLGIAAVLQRRGITLRA